MSGREIPIPIFTCAIVGIGTTIINAKRIAPQSNFFIVLPPFFDKFLIFHSPGQVLFSFMININIDVLTFGRRKGLQDL
jgi:hypothetical protein